MGLLRQAVGADVEGIVHTYGRDELGRVRSVLTSEGPAGRSTEYFHDGAARVIEEIERAGALVRARAAPSIAPAGWFRRPTRRN